MPLVRLPRPNLPFTACRVVVLRRVVGACLAAWGWLSLGTAVAQSEYETIEILYEQGAADASGQVLWVWLATSAGVLLLGWAWWLVHRARRLARKLEVQLEQANHRLADAQLVARVGSWNRNFETGETFWSEEARKVLGLGNAPLDYHHYERMVHPDDVERVTEVIAAAYYQGGKYQCDHRVICPGNVEKYVRLSGQVFLGGDQAPVQETGTVQDITEQRLAESAIQRSEQRLRVALDASPFPTLILEDSETLPLLFANRATYTQFRIDAGQVLDDIMLAKFWVDANELDNIVASMRQGQTVQSHEVLLVDSRGHQFWGEVNGNALDYAGIDTLCMTLVDVSEQRRIRAELERLALTDMLTGALNRRSFLDAMQRELRRSLRYRNSFSLVLLDIDYFKRINDHFGHEFGDAVIRRFCEVAKTCLREEDLFGRIGGEEFAAVLVSAEEGGGYLVAERIRKRWQDEAFDVRGARSNFTVSIGVAQLQSDTDTVEAIMERANRGLRDAKRAGRNCVIVFSGERPAGLTG